MLSKKAVSVIQYIFFLGFGILLLWLGFRKLDLSEVWRDILRADYGWLFAGLAVAVVSHIFRAMRWNLLINASGYNTRLSSTFYSVMFGYLANTAVPRMGEFARCGVLSKKEKIPFNTLFGTVISERFFDLFVLGLIILLMIVLQLELVGGFVYKVLQPLLSLIFSNIAGIIVVSVLGLLLIAGMVYLLLVFRTRIKSISFYGRFRTYIDGIIGGVKTIINMRQKWLFLFYTLLIWVSYSLMVYLPFGMLRETSPLNLLDGTTVMALGSLGIVAPVPGGIGAYHYITKVILTEIYTVEANAAMSYATLTHAGQTMLNVVLGTISYLVMGFSSRKQRPVNG